MAPPARPRHSVALRWALGLVAGIVAGVAVGFVVGLVRPRGWPGR